MIINTLGKTDIRLTAIGLGTYAMGGGEYQYGWGKQDDKESVATIKRALELGINWIDVAPLYGEGRAERVVGEAIKGMRDKVIISTKCGLFMDENKEDFTYNLKEESIRAEIEGSLNRLQTDVIDLYQLHRPFPEEQLDEGWGTLEKLVKEGKVRYAGVSAFNLEQLRRVQDIYPVAFLQPHYNMIYSSIENDGVMDYCREKSIGIVSYSTMAAGLLTGKFTREKLDSLPDDDLRKVVEPFQEPFLTVNLELVEKLRTIADRNGKTVAHLAIAWVLRKPEATSAIVGARRPDQIEQTVPAGDWVLSNEDQSEVDQILDQYRVAVNRLKTQG